MEWVPEASAKMNEMLNDVPVMMRGIAKSMASAAAEHLAGERGAGEVAVDDMLRGFIKATPVHLRNDLKRLFEAHHIDSEKFTTEFEQ